MAGVMISTTDFAQHTLDQVVFMTDIFWPVSDWFFLCIHEVLSNSYPYSLVFRHVYLWIPWGALHIVHYFTVFCLANTMCYNDWFILLSQFWKITLDMPYFQKVLGCFFSPKLLGVQIHFCLISYGNTYNLQIMYFGIIYCFWIMNYVSVLARLK